MWKRPVSSGLPFNPCSVRRHCASCAMRAAVGVSGKIAKNSRSVSFGASSNPAIENCSGMRRASQCTLVNLRREAHGKLAVYIQDGTLDHRRLPAHQRNRPFLREPVLIFFRQLSVRRTGAVYQHLPTHLARPALQHAALNARSLVIVKRIRDATAVEPGARLLHRVAILDAVNYGGHTSSAMHCKTNTRACAQSRREYVSASTYME